VKIKGVGYSPPPIKSTNLFGERIIDYKKSQGLSGFQGIMNPNVYKNRQEKEKKTNKIDEILKEVKEDLKF